MPHLQLGCMPDPVQLPGRRESKRMARRPIGFGLEQRMNEQDVGHKVCLQSRLIQKTSLIADYELRNACDRRRQHNVSSRHRLHQH
jgi:hypothetical protein